MHGSPGLQVSCIGMAPPGLLSYSAGGVSDTASARTNDAWGVRGTDLLHYPSFQLFTDVPPSETFFNYIGELWHVKASSAAIQPGVERAIHASDPTMASPGGSLPRSYLTRRASTTHNLPVCLRMCL